MPACDSQSLTLSTMCHRFFSVLSSYEVWDQFIANICFWHIWINVKCSEMSSEMMLSESWWLNDCAHRWRLLISDSINLKVHFWLLNQFWLLTSLLTFSLSSEFSVHFWLSNTIFESHFWFLVWKYAYHLLKWLLTSTVIYSTRMFHHSDHIRLWHEH